jgi:hypothetical protein
MVNHAAPIHILIADEQPIFRQGMRMLLDAVPEWLRRPTTSPIASPCCTMAASSPSSGQAGNLHVVATRVAEDLSTASGRLVIPVMPFLLAMFVPVWSRWITESSA